MCSPVPVPGDVTAASPLHHPPGRGPPPGAGHSAEPPPSRPVGQGPRPAAAAAAPGVGTATGDFGTDAKVAGGARGRGVE